MSKKKEIILRKVIYYTATENIEVIETANGFTITEGVHTSYVSKVFPSYNLINHLLNSLNVHRERLIKIIDSDACKPFKGDGRNVFDIIDDTLGIKK